MDVKKFTPSLKNKKMDIKKFIPSLKKKKKKKWTSKIWNYFLKLLFEIIFWN